jgi:4-amino-4-deoxy-L-arabinose transferase-like glycosyltransferase
MDTATITRPQPAQPSAVPPTPPPRSRRLRRTAVRTRRRGFHGPALALLLIVTFLLRLWGIKQGLPYSYNVDEATHFVPRAVAFSGHDLNPHYFLNPPAYSYLLHIVFELWFGSSDAVSRAYATNPTELFVVARVVAAVLGTIAVWLTYLAGTRFFNRNVGLMAAAIFGLAFLPIFYSHLALNDVPTLAPVALSLYGISGVMRRGRLRDYVIAGAGVGLASATKYTGGITLLCLAAAFVSDSVGGAFWIATRRFAAGLLVALIAFVLANPYSVLDPSAFQAGVSAQASLAAGQDPVKLGTRPGGGTGYYLWTFTWGLGWGATLAAIGGSILLLVRRRAAMAMVLIPAPIVFVIYMGHQQRYFGRWLMPVFPIVAILGAYGAVALIRWLIRARRIPAPLAAGIVGVVLLAQGFVAAVHDDAVLSRPDTRNIVRQWMVAHVPPGSKVVIEPVVADNWASDVGTSLPWTPTGDRWYRFPTWMTQLDAQGNPLPADERGYIVVDQYERYLQPALLNEYLNEGYCWIVIGSFQAGRAFAQPQLAPAAIAYYNELASRAQLVYHVSPFSRGARAVPFNFDWATDYYPRQYHRPGPELSVYKLSGGKCG